MKRRGLFILLLLVAGAILNVAVAWGFELCDLPFREVTHSWPIIEVPEGFQRPAYGHGIESWGTTHLSDWVDTSTEYLGNLTVHLAGWPRRSLYSERHYVKEWLGIPGLQRFDSPQSFSEGIAIPRWLRGNPYKCFPTRPLWPGFAINTVFYAVVLWLLFAAPFALRRRRRIKRGLCPKCAYPVGTNKVCTECGAVVNRMPE